MRKNKFNSGRVIVRLAHLPAKLLIFTAIIFLVIFFIIAYFWRFLKTSDFFKIKDIITIEADAIDFAYLKGKNIFSIDLKNESGYILDSYPDCSKVLLVRVLPNRIFVDFIKRKPVALLKLYRYFALDKEAVLFNYTSQTEEPDLPVILGLETKIFGPKLGRGYAIGELLLALDIIKEAGRNRVFKNYKIKKINVANLSDASIFMTFSAKEQGLIRTEGLEVKLGEGNIKDKITTLGGFISSAKFGLGNIKYIDLRFKEPVISLKDAK